MSTTFSKEMQKMGENANDLRRRETLFVQSAAQPSVFSHNLLFPFERTASRVKLHGRLKTSTKR